MAILELSLPPIDLGLPVPPPSFTGSDDGSDDVGQPKPDLITRLNTFCTDLTQLALDGKLSVAYGRDAEVEEALRALASPRTLFPMLTGGPRSGKTTVAHHVANRIVRAECPEPLKGLCVYETTPSRLINGLGGLHQWMSEINGLLASLTQSNVVLFLRDFHTALGLGIPPSESGPDLASALGELLQSTHPRMLFEARSRGLERMFTEAAALRSLFAPIKVDAMTREAAAPVIRRAAEDLEIVHEVGIGEDACDEALELAARFLLNEALPGSALDMLKDTLTTAGSGNGGTKTLTRADVRHRFIQRSGLPEFLVNDDAPYDEEAARKFLTQRVFGQEVAVEAVLRIIALVRARLNNPQRPMGVFLFLGPIGVGKTELVKALARFLFGGEERIVRFNMADFNNPWTAVDRMFGDPHGSTELVERLGTLSARMAQQTFAVLSLDEFEKAIPDMHQRFLQLFDEGILVNGQGEELNLRNTVIVLTSNLGAQLLNPQLGFRVGDPVEEAERAIIRESEAYFRPEFINRLDAVCFFKPLSRNVIRQIAQREVTDVIAREGITRRGLRISVDDSVIDLLVERGYDLRFGARYLKRQIERSITYPLARQIARKRLPDGATVRLIARGGEIAVWVVDEGGENEDTRLEKDAISHLQSLPAKELRARLNALGERIERMLEQHHIAELKARVSAMIERIGQPDFWQHPQEATAQIEAMNLLSQRVDQAENVRRLFEQCGGALKRAATVRGKAAVSDLAEANRLYAELARELPLAETMLCLRSDEDQAGAFVTVRAIVAANEDTALPAEWARDLALMYAEWAKSRGFPVTLVNEMTSGDGVIEATINIVGFGAYALLKGETGLHRLVRQSPKRDGERISVWARVEVLPDAPVASNAANEVRIEHRPLREPGVLTNKLLRQTTITLGKAGEAGGQRTIVWRHALPADEIEGHARRYVPRWLNAQQQLVQVDGSEPVKLADQVRTYTLFKQASVKDARTGLTSTQPKKVLAGALDEFLIAYLTASLG